MSDEFFGKGVFFVILWSDSQVGAQRAVYGKTSSVFLAAGKTNLGHLEGPVHSKFIEIH